MLIRTLGLAGVAMAVGAAAAYCAVAAAAIPVAQSTISLAISVELSRFEAALRRQIAASSLARPGAHEGKSRGGEMHYRVDWRADPSAASLAMRGDELLISIPVVLGAALKPLGQAATVYEPSRCDNLTTRVTFATTLAVNPSGVALRAGDPAVRVSPLSHKCELRRRRALDSAILGGLHEIFSGQRLGDRIDIGALLADAIQGALRPAPQTLSVGLAGVFDAEAFAAAARTTLAAPIELIDEVWLSVNPQAIRVTGITGHGNAATLMLDISALPRLAFSPQALAVPASDSVAAKDRRIHVPLTLVLPRGTHTASAAAGLRPASGRLLEAAPQTVPGYRNLAVVRHSNGRAIVYVSGETTNRLPGEPELERVLARPIDASELLDQIGRWLDDSTLWPADAGRPLKDLGRALDDVRGLLSRFADREHVFDFQGGRRLSVARGRITIHNLRIMPHALEVGLMASAEVSIASDAGKRGP